MPIWIPMAIAAGVSTISNIVGNRQAAKVARQNTNLTIAENKKQAELAYKREQENISQMNKYNAPSSQMQRFAEAGLNKNLIYQQGSPGNQSQLARYSPPNISYQYKPKYVGNEFDNAENLLSSYYQIKNAAAQGRVTEAKAVMEEAMTKYAKMLAKNKAYASMNQWQKDQMEYVLGQAQIEKMFNIQEDSAGVPAFQLKPEYADKLIQSIVDKWSQISTTLSKSQADIEIKDQLLKNLSVIPWLQPLIQFFKLF